MTYSPLLIVHICGGVIGFLAGSTALLVRKGSPLHLMAGRIFVIAMMCMAASGGYLAFVKSQRVNVVAGVFTFYLVATAWLTVKRKAGETGLLEFGLLLVALATGTSVVVFAWQAAHGTTASNAGGPAEAYVVFLLVAFLAVVGDVRMLIRGGVSGAQRMVRHLWRMCFALFVATGSFFLGTAGDPVLRRTGLRARLFTPSVRHTHLPEVPVVIIAVLTIFWLFRVKFSKAYRKAGKETRPVVPERSSHAGNSLPA